MEYFFLVVHRLVRLGYFFFRPLKVYSNSAESGPISGAPGRLMYGVFHLKPEKQKKFMELVKAILVSHWVLVRTMQRRAGKCVLFSLVVPGAKLFTREMNAAISTGLRRMKPILVKGTLREDISLWLILEKWDQP